MPNNYLCHNIGEMENQIAYESVLNKSRELGLDLEPIISRRDTSTTQRWNNEIKKLDKQIKNRNNNYNVAIQLARDYREPLIIPNRLTGTNYATWRREVKRLRMRIKRRPSPEIIRMRNIKRELIESVNNRNTRLQFNRLIEAGQFQEVLNIIINDNKQLTEQQANRMYNIMKSNKWRLLIEYEEGKSQNIPVNAATSEFFIRLLENGRNIVSGGISYGSDVLDQIDITRIRKLTLTRLERPNRVIANRDGQFFSYINTTILDLLKYQIFNQEQAYDKNLINNREHCLLHTFLECGVNKTIVNTIKLSYVNGYNIRKKDIKKMADIINKNINIHSIGPDGEIDIAKIKSSTITEDKIDIAIYENHYFKFEKTIYTKYFINNYEEIKDVNNCYNITNHQIINGKKYFKYSENKTKINSLLMVDVLFKQGHFKKLDLVKFEEASKNKELKDHIYLDNIENEQSPLTEKQEKNNDVSIYYADCESFVKGEHHSLYLIGFVGDKNDNVEILNVCAEAYEKEDVSREQLMVNDFLNSITKSGKQKALCYFHNLKYDYHLLEPYINIKNKCEKDNQIYNVKIIFRKCEIELRDSYKIIPFALSKFQKEFNLPKQFGKKEAIAYNYYTKENNNKVISTKLYTDLLSNEEQEIFKKEIHTEYTYDVYYKTFNPTSYYMEYLKLDCLVLKKGIKKFNELILEITENKMTVYESLTISSLTDKYMVKEGAYEGVYKTTGNLRAYIAKAVYGGRVNVNPKYIKQVINKKLADYDGVSLYPSSINRLCRETGLPIGKAKRFNENNCESTCKFEEWKNKTYSIMTIKITKVNKIQQMPFIAHKKESSIEYLNEAPEGEIVVDSITLQDYIDFHNIEYEILDGVYWNEGGNNKMGEVVKKLFETRLKYKNSNVALSNVIKLMLNSAYGKTIMKKTNTETKIIKTNYKTFDKETGKWSKKEKTPFNDYIYNNFNTIKSWRQLNDSCYEVERVCSDNSSNRGHIGCAILSMSKRIMNEVFDTANNNDINIYYTDTDSIHMDNDKVSKLEEEYKKKYNKELNGKYLEQFHTDFNLEGAVGEIYATKSIFLGKKSYLDVLESKDEKGNIINGFHFRMKGITEEGLLKASKDYKDSYLGLYTELAKGIKKKIVLNPFNEDENKQKVLFEFKDGKVSTRKEFIREVCF